MSNCSNDDFKQYLYIQCEEILKYKWIESEKVGRDLGDCAVSDWIAKYAKQFRENYYKNQVK